MIVEFRDADRLLGTKALGMYRKGLEAASSACDKVYVATLPIQAADSAAGAAESWLYEALEEMGVGEVRERNMPHEYALALRTACSVYLTQLGKLSEKQADLLVPLDETNEVISHLQSLADRLKGQMELAGISSVTISVPGSGRDPVTMTGAEFSKAAKRASRRASIDT